MRGEDNARLQKALEERKVNSRETRESTGGTPVLPVQIDLQKIAPSRGERGGTAFGADFPFAFKTLRGANWILLRPNFSFNGVNSGDGDSLRARFLFLLPGGVLRGTG
jgi:hypothetical protein